MRIRRNYNEPFFRDRRKNHTLRNLFFLLLVGGGIIAYLVSQPQMVVDTALRYFGPELTPTPQPSQLAQQAQDLFFAGDLEASAQMWERAIAIRPDSIDYLYEYGMILIDQDDGRNNTAERAIEIAQQIINLNVNEPRGYALRARALAWTGDGSAAIPVAQAGIDLAPEFSPLYEALSRAYMGEGRLREGQEAGLLAIEYAPSDVRAYWAYASALFFSGARQDAVSQYQRALEIQPNFLPPYFELAILYLAENRDQDAIDTYDRILGVQPRNARALLRQCEAYRKIGQFERALGLCQDAVTSDPTYADAQYRYGLMLYADQQDFVGARNAFQACLDYDAGDLQCRYRLGLAYYYVARQEYQEQCAAERLSPLQCGAQATCRQGWDLLDQSLTMALGSTNTTGDLEIIRTGMVAIAQDPACVGVADNRRLEITPEVTPETTAEAEGSA